MATRQQQRARTQQAIIDAAGALVHDGHSDLTIDDIAEAAGVSRATVYRYFESASHIVWHTFADQHIDPPDTAMAGVDDVVERVLIAERLVNDFLFGDALGARTFEHATLSRTLDGSGTDADRKARRLVYIDAALAPIADALGDRLDEVRHALALAMGSQVVAAMLDTCRLTPDDARNATRFACRSIAEAAVRLSRSPG